MGNNLAALLPFLFYAGSIGLLIRYKTWQKVVLLGIPILSIFIFFFLHKGVSGQLNFFGYALNISRLDSLSYPFVLIFLIMSILGSIYSLHHTDRLQHCSSLAYAGSAIGVVLAGDWFTLYVFWELMAIFSTFLILARRTEGARKAAFRYFSVHVLGGLLLLGGILMEVKTAKGLQIGHLDLKGLSSWLIFLGIALNGAIPPLHAWLKDAYPEATVTGAVFMSAFTTKSAVYLMARVFAGTELLIWLGAIMTILPVFYAEVENDLRRVLSYSIINQVGFMMCGVGIGTQLAINGAVSHAFCHIIYKALLFMSTGAVLHVTGRIRCTELGGVYKTMPITALFCMIAAASISAFPLFSGFVSKSMIISASENERLIIAWLMLQFASAGVIAHAGIKVPFFAFFGHDRGLRAKEPPINMLFSMGVAAFLCVFLGVYPKPLYQILPYPVDYVPYTGHHVISQGQLLLFAILAFYLMLKAGVYPPELKAINLDLDWFYRRLLGGYLLPWLLRLIELISSWAYRVISVGLTRSLCLLPNRLPNLLVGLCLGLLRPFSIYERLKKELLDTLLKEPSSISMALAVVGIFLLWILL